MKKNRLEWVAGSLIPGDPVQYYQCHKCGTVVIDDNNKNPGYAIFEYDCPICKPIEEFPFEYVTSDKIEEYKVPAIHFNKKGEMEKSKLTLKQRLKAGFNLP